MKKVKFKKAIKEVMKGVLTAGCLISVLLLFLGPYVPIVCYYRTLAIAGLMIILSLAYVICAPYSTKK